MSDGCGGGVRRRRQRRCRRPRRSTASDEEEPPEYIPNAGFLLYEGEKGQIYMRLFSYARYLNQKGLDPTYTDSFGNTTTVQAARGHPAQQVLPAVLRLVPDAEVPLLPLRLVGEHRAGRSRAGGRRRQPELRLQRYVTLGAGITSLPSVRSTEGQFPYWLGVDDRLTADEFFRGSYTTGIWLKGEISTKLKYMAMLGNNLSTLGVSASQLDNKLDTTSFMLTVAARRPASSGSTARSATTTVTRTLATRLGGALHAQPRGQADPAGHRTRSRTARSG